MAPRTYYISKIIKGTIMQIMNNCQALSKPRPIEPHHFNQLQSHVQTLWPASREIFTLLSGKRLYKCEYMHYSLQLKVLSSEN